MVQSRRARLGRRGSGSQLAEALSSLVLTWGGSRSEFGRRSSSPSQCGVAGRSRWILRCRRGFLVLSPPQVSLWSRALTGPRPGCLAAGEPEARTTMPTRRIAARVIPRSLAIQCRHKSILRHPEAARRGAPHCFSSGHCDPSISAVSRSGVCLVPRTRFHSPLRWPECGSGKLFLSPSPDSKSTEP